MSNWNNESEAREQIKALVAEYYNDFKHNDDKNEDLLEEEKIEINKNVDYSIVWRQSTK